MKKAVWAGLLVLLAGGAFVAATAIDRAPRNNVSQEDAAQRQQAEPNPAEDSAENAAAAAEVEATNATPSQKITQPTVEPVIYGNTDASVVIEEFASFTCSHCADFHAGTLPELTKKFLATGQARLHLNSFIRNEQDLRATMLVYCVEGTEKRQRFIKAILQAQEQWAFSADFLNNLRALAQVGGVSNEDFESCMANKELEDKLLQNREYATHLGLASTPYFVIGEQKIIGAQSVDTFATAIANAKNASTPAPSAATTPAAASTEETDKK